VLELNLLATSGLLPDRTFFLAIPPEGTAGRRDAQPDRIEREGEEFTALVDQGYRELATIFAQRVVSIDATMPASDISREVRGQLRDLA
jgi:dTMP kinase